MPSELDKRHAYTFRQGGYPIHSNSQMLLDKPLECYPLDKEWQKRINRSCWWASGYTGPEKGGLKEVKLIKKLLSFGGYEACMAYNEPDADVILERGQLWYGDKTRVMRGERSHCHRNCCKVWQMNSGRHEMAIVTGYALSADGMWRQHSWLVLRTSKNVKIIETTEPRIAYYGFVMTMDEADQFCNCNQ